MSGEQTPTRREEAEPQLPDYSYVCGICKLPILTHYHDRHSDGSGHYHISCEVGHVPLYLNWLKKEARNLIFNVR